MRRCRTKKHALWVARIAVRHRTGSRDVVRRSPGRDRSWHRLPAAWAKYTRTAASECQTPFSCGGGVRRSPPGARAPSTSRRTRRAMPTDRLRQGSYANVHCICRLLTPTTDAKGSVPTTSTNRRPGLVPPDCTHASCASAAHSRFGFNQPPNMWFRAGPSGKSQKYWEAQWGARSFLAECAGPMSSERAGPSGRVWAGAAGAS